MPLIKTPFSDSLVTPATPKTVGENASSMEPNLPSDFPNGTPNMFKEVLRDSSVTRGSGHKTPPSSLEAGGNLKIKA